MRSFVLIPLLALTVSCAAKVPQRTEVFLSRTATAPADLAILPVEDDTGHSLSPVEQIRAAAAGILMERGYSPLSRDLVDRELGGGAVPASSLRLPDAGVLELRVVKWHAIQVDTRGRLDATLEARLFSPEGVLVARVTRPGEVALGSAELSLLGPEERRGRLIHLVLEDLLSSLPAPPPL